MFIDLTARNFNLNVLDIAIDRGMHFAHFQGDSVHRKLVKDDPGDMISQSFEQGKRRSLHRLLDDIVNSVVINGISQSIRFAREAEICLKLTVDLKEPTGLFLGFGNTVIAVEGKSAEADDIVHRSVLAWNRVILRLILEAAWAKASAPAVSENLKNP